MDILTELFPAELADINAAIEQAVQGLPDPLRQPAVGSALTPGKRLRPLICVAVARCLGLSDNSVFNLAAAVEILHCATLVHDDILDQAAFRRGQPTVHCRCGVHQAILAGDAMFALASRLTAEQGQPELVRVFSRAVEKTVAGQALEWSLLHNPLTGWPEYERIISGKTAALFEAAASSGALLAGAGPKEREQAAAFGKNLGMGFQFRDDLLDFMPQAVTGKPQGRDLLDGKLTAPTLLWLAGQTEPDRQAWLGKFAAKTLQAADLAFIGAEITGSASSVFSRLATAVYWENARSQLMRLPNNEFRSNLNTIIEHLSRIDVPQHDPAPCR